jgi:hypothetical protein
MMYTRFQTVSSTIISIPDDEGTNSFQILKIHSTLTWLFDQEDYTAFSRHKNFRPYITPHLWTWKTIILTIQYRGTLQYTCVWTWNNKKIIYCNPRQILCCSYNPFVRIM